MYSRHRTTCKQSLQYRDAGGIAVGVKLPFDRLEGHVGGDDIVDVFRGEFAVLVAKVLAQLAIQQVGVDQLHAAAPVGAREVVGGAPRAAATARPWRAPQSGGGTGRSQITIVEGEGGAKHPGE